MSMRGFATAWTCNQLVHRRPYLHFFTGYHAYFICSAGLDGREILHKASTR